MTKDELVEEDSLSGKNYLDPPPVKMFEMRELKKWSFYRAVIAEFIATLLFLYVTVLTVIGFKSQTDTNSGGGACASVGLLGISWAFGGMIFILVYCTAGISGGHINPAVTFGLFLASKVSLVRAVSYMMAQCLGATCGVGLVKAFQSPIVFILLNMCSYDCLKLKVLAPLPIGFSVFMVHLATIPITGTGINPARSFGAAVIYNNQKAWDDQWIFWVGPFVGAAIAAFYHQFVLRAGAMKAYGSVRSQLHELHA